MRSQEESLRDAIAKLKARLEAETAKSKEFGGKIKDALGQLQQECDAHDETKVTPNNAFKSSSFSSSSHPFRPSHPPESPSSSRLTPAPSPNSSGSCCRTNQTPHFSSPTAKFWRENSQKPKKN
jgi:hypothetical protein